MVAQAACFLLLIYQAQGMEIRIKGGGDVMRRCLMKHSRTPDGQHFTACPHPALPAQPSLLSMSAPHCLGIFKHGHRAAGCGILIGGFLGVLGVGACSGMGCRAPQIALLNFQKLSFRDPPTGDHHEGGSRDRR